MRIETIFGIIILFILTIPQGCLRSDYIKLGDPTIFFSQGTYYLYGTGSKNGFEVYISKDKKHWIGSAGVENGFALRKENVYGNHGFWAPQVFQHKNTFYLAYTANEHVAIAQSESPLGPFVQKEKKPIQSNFKQIDPYVFIDAGKIYLYYVKVANGGNRIFVSELNSDFSALKSETSVQCIEATKHWENVENANWSVIEGPSVFKLNSKYYLIYSANHFKSPDYSVGYAVADSPMGPWEKCNENPILNRQLVNFNGTGHGDIFKDADGWNYVFHTHFSNKKVNPRKTAIIRAEWSENYQKAFKKLNFDPESFYYLSANKKSNND
jgi:beta-xylosidase